MRQSRCSGIVTRKRCEENITVSRLHLNKITTYPEIDILVYALYCLTDDEIVVVEGKK